MAKIRWGILGCGKIANKFASDLRLVQDATLAAVASRDSENARAFAAQYGAELWFDNYDALAMSDQVDVIYIATPHGFHYEHTLLCINNGKAVLCEKAFALNTYQLQEMIQTSRNRKVFLMEAFWTKFLPQYQKLTTKISAGEIGEIRMIQADFGFRAAEPTPQRFYDPALGGGALLDIGIYPVFLAVSLLGKPEEIIAQMNAYPTGVDKQIAITMKFKSGALAALTATFEAETPVEATVAGTLGFLRLKNRWHNAASVLEIALGKEHPIEIAVDREEGFGYQFEARHVTECLQQGLTESPVMKHTDSLLLMETLDAIRAICGIRYPVD